MTQNIWAKIGSHNLFYIARFSIFSIGFPLMRDEYYGNDITYINKILYTTNTSNDVD